MATLQEHGVKDGDQIVVIGEVAYSAVAERVEGERLKRSIEREERQGFNKYPQRNPHYSLALVNVQIDPSSQGKPLATYYGEKTYQNKDGLTALSLVSTSKFSPRFYHEQEDGGVVQLEKLPAELDKGQKVKVLISAFTSRQYNNLGSTFDSILLPAGDINYYQNNAKAEIEAFGFSADQLVQPDTPEPEVVTEDVTNNPFGGSAGEPAQEPTAPTDNVAADAQPDTPPTNPGRVDNPFA